MMVIFMYDFGLRFILLLYFIMLVSNYSMVLIFSILREYAEKFDSQIQRSLLHEDSYQNIGTGNKSRMHDIM